MICSCCFNSNTTGVISGAEIANPSRAPVFIPGFSGVRVAQSIVFCVVFCGYIILNTNTLNYEATPSFTFTVVFNATFNNIVISVIIAKRKWIQEQTMIKFTAISLVGLSCSIYVTYIYSRILVSSTISISDDSACWSSTKQTSSSLSHKNVTCASRDITDKC
jgi:hypothetical protein